MGRTNRFILILMLVCCTIGLSACGQKKETAWNEVDEIISEKIAYDHRMELKYATEFTIDYYSDGFTLISIVDGSRFLLYNEGSRIPEDLDDDIVPLVKNVDHIYLVASATMDMFDAIDGLSNICLSGIKPEDWCIESAREAMDKGELLYAGKYNMPDYERIICSECKLAIESTMIYHTPEVKEELEKAGIPVLVDHSSYEKHPLGRTEWVKLYGALTGRDEAAQIAFEDQAAQYQELGEIEPTGKSVVFFYVTNHKTVVVRKANDYVAKMIEMAGGEYLFADLVDDTKQSSSVNMQFEKFYKEAKDADYLVYNSTIDGEISSISDLLGKSKAFEDFKAVKEGHVFGTTQNVYQQSMESGAMIKQFYKMLTSEDELDEGTFIYKVQ